MDRSQPLPTSLQNEFIPEEVLLSLTNAANAGPCPENLLPAKKIKTPKVCVCVCVCIKYLGTFILTSSSLSIYLICFIFQIVLRIF